MRKSVLILEGLSKVQEKKNSSGGEVIRELSYGNIKIVYETYWHSFLQKRILITVGGHTLGVVCHIDCDEAFEKCWKEIKDYLEDIKKNTPSGEASYYYYQSNHPKVKEELVNILNKYKKKMVTKKYDKASGKVIEESKSFKVPNDLKKAFDEFWEEYGANDYREFMWKMSEFSNKNKALCKKYPDYKTYAQQYLKDKAE